MPILILRVIFQLLENWHLLEDQEFDVAIVDLLYNECGLALARGGILYIQFIFSEEKVFNRGLVSLMAKFRLIED